MLPIFPERSDLPALNDKEAHAALALLRGLVNSACCDVYTAAGGVRKDGRYLWNVWIEHHIVAGGKRVPLRTWAADALLLVSHDPDAA